PNLHQPTPPPPFHVACLSSSCGGHLEPTSQCSLYMLTRHRPACIDGRVGLDGAGSHGRHDMCGAHRPCHAISNACSSSSTWQSEMGGMSGLLAPSTSPSPSPSNLHEQVAS